MELAARELIRGEECLLRPQVTVEEGNVQTLLPAACLLQLAEIQEACCEFLKRQLDPSNCLGIRAFADTHSCRELLRIADKFTQHNFQEVKKVFTSFLPPFLPIVVFCCAFMLRDLKNVCQMFDGGSDVGA